MTEENSGHFMGYFYNDTFLRFTLMFPVIILHFGIFSNGYQAASTK
jgi:hypothetical protein